MFIGQKTVGLYEGGLSEEPMITSMQEPSLEFADASLAGGSVEDARSDALCFARASRKVDSNVLEQGGVCGREDAAECVGERKRERLSLGAMEGDGKASRGDSQPRGRLLGFVAMLADPASPLASPRGDDAWLSSAPDAGAMYSLSVTVSSPLRKSSP